MACVSMAVRRGWILALALAACRGDAREEPQGVDLIEYPNKSEARKPQPPIRSPLLDAGFTFAGKAGFSVEPTAKGAELVVPAKDGEKTSTTYSMRGSNCEIRDFDKQLVATIYGTPEKYEIRRRERGELYLVRKKLGVYEFTDGAGAPLCRIEHGLAWRVLQPNGDEIGTVAYRETTTYVRRTGNGEELTLKGRIEGLAAACLLLPIDRGLQVGLMLRIKSGK